MKNEVKLYNQFIDFMHPDLDAIRIENTCIPGCFDVYVRHRNGNHLWLENKIANFKEKVCFEPSQYIFMLEHIFQFNGRCTALVSSRGSIEEHYVLDLTSIPKDIIFDAQRKHYTVEEYSKISEDMRLNFFSKHDNMRSAADRIKRLCEVPLKS